jgi:hypothetical protein
MGSGEAGAIGRVTATTGALAADFRWRTLGLTVAMAAASSVKPSPKAGQGLRWNQEIKRDSGDGKTRAGFGLGRRDSRI